MHNRSDVEQLVALMYTLLLDREATTNEIEFHVEGYIKGLPITEVVRGIAFSTEAENLKIKTRTELMRHATLAAELNQTVFYNASISDTERAELVRTMYGLAFGRRAEPEEIDIWKNYLSNNLRATDFVHKIATSEERKQKNNRLRSISKLPIGEIVQIAFREILGTGVNWTDIEFYSEAIRLDVMSEAMLVAQLFQQRLMQLVPVTTPNAAVLPDSEPTIYMLGTNRMIPLSDWHSPPLVGEPRYIARSISRQSNRQEVRVSAIASMYKGGKYIASFLDNITSQTIFEDLCELIIVDACSPEHEIDIIRPYMERFANIKYHRTDERIGIYDAWNTGIKLSKGKYITNTNMDDLRRADSFELQYKCFEHVGIADIVYQDFLYSFEEGLSFEEIARHNIHCRLPIVTTNNLTVFNSPHNAPMWRRSLHDQVGWFDDRYRSAGDCDFWLRCALAGKTFFKLNDPHVAYYWNPTGLSTGAETLGIIEHRNIMKELGPNLVPKDLLTSYDEFRNSLALNDQALPLDTSRYGLVQSKMLSLDTLYSIQSEANQR